MPNNTRDIKRGIRSISSTRQITRAMQLVAMSKMKRAQRKAQDAAAYSQGVGEILANLTHHLGQTHFHPFWEKNSSSKMAVILMSSDRGFCAGLNINLWAKVWAFIQEQKAAGVEVELVTVGKKGRDLARRAGYEVVADFSGLGEPFSWQDVRSIVTLVTQDFLALQYRQVYLAYTEFVNTLVQKPHLSQILPVDENIFSEVGQIDKSATERPKLDYIFEPSAAVVLEEFIPYLMEVMIYKALLEARASEHSARMLAMKQATDRAGEVVGDLRLAYNQARQASITREMAEISAGVMR